MKTSTPNGRFCEECGDPLTGLQIYLCDKRIKPGCSHDRLLIQRAAHKRAVYGREKKAKAKEKELRKRCRYGIGGIQSATPEKLIKIVHKIIKEAR